MFIALAVAVVVLIALAVVISMRPDTFRLSRSRTLAAPPNAVFAYVNDFHKWREWSPWEHLDPNMKKEISGAPSGVGAVYYWSGNNKAGEGRMTILDSEPPRKLRIQLEFMKPWKATNTAHFDFEPSGSGTQATWAMTGHNNFVGKAFSLVMNMDKMVGPDFERGLHKLDEVTSAKK